MPTGEKEISQAFVDADISKEVLRALEKMGIEKMTAVQQKTLPLMMEGRDVIGIAPTGTGKTLAFGIPMLEYVNLKDNRVQELVLAPTRELSLQIAEELRNLSQFIPGLRIAVIYGGQPIVKQITELKRHPQVVIATPGRLLDHMNRGNIRLDSVHTMVLDEADEMLNMGFVKDVTKIIEATPAGRQLVLFSATTNQEVLTIAWKYQQDPVEVNIPATQENRPRITQYVIETAREKKYEHLLYLLDSDVYQRVMVFINTKDMTQRLTKRLQDAGYPAECLHGDMRQSARTQVMQEYRKGKFQILLATDVAARGIDVDDVEAVINYDLPNENEYYTHRIGRTGRAKKHGVAFTLLTYSESVRLDAILKYIDAKPVPLKFNDMGILCDEEGKPFFENM
ncbi:MAG: DEAD/DEAH box helicase [Candidatus Limiplasma sp.]|nr:DEAD/DEAH box helicase [Candidatus Limiplasma sp.]MEA5146829.1 DEAD/DEAH box helicase [Candidatus Limiplasma sp.]